MRWNLVARTGELVRRGFLQLLAQGAHILLQSVYLLLLAKHCAVERIEKVFGKTHLGLKFVQFSFHNAFPGAGALKRKHHCNAAQHGCHAGTHRMTSKGEMDYICAFDFLPGAAGGT